MKANLSSRRPLLTATLLLAGAWGLPAQGLVDFSNAPWEYWPDSFDRLIYQGSTSSGSPIADSTWTAALFEGRAGNWVQLGERCNFFGPIVPGVISNDFVPRVISVSQGVATTLQIRVYDSTGTELPVTDGTNAFSFTMGTSLPPSPTDTLMINLRAFAVGQGARVIDIGLRMFDGTATNRIACELPRPSGTLTSPLRIAKNGTNYGIVLVETNAPDASRFRIPTPTGIKAWKKLP